MRIVDDDVSWNSIAADQEKEEEEEDEGDMPVVAEFIDERPDAVKLMEEFRTNAKWKLLGDQPEDSLSSDVPGAAVRRQRHDSPDSSPPRVLRHASPDRSPSAQQRHDSLDPSPPQRETNHSANLLPPWRQRHDSPDPSPPRRKRHDSPDLSPPRRQRHDSPDASPKRAGSSIGQKGHKSPDRPRLGAAQGEQPRLRRGASEQSSSRQKRQATPDLSPPRKKRYDSDLDSSPPRRARPGSPALRRQSRTTGTLPAGRERPRSRSPRDPSPRRHRDAQGSPKEADVTFSGPRAGLLSADVLRREQQELRRQERSNRHLEEESRHTETVFRDKSGRRRDLAQERLEQQQRAEAQAERDEQYAKWGKGLAQDRQQQQNVEDAIKEMQKPLARYIDDQDLDRMLREQEREGDPMADLIKKRKAKENKEKKEKPRYKGPAPPLNRFNIWPGHRWDGVDRSNGFEQQRFARIANKKAVQELAYKWSVEDM